MSNITIRINSIETRKSEAKGPYSYGKATILKKDGTERDVTIMSFGEQRASVSKMLRKGRKLTLSAVFDGGVLKILGPQRVAAVADEAVAA